jgi:nucleotide-binding universal stress UspA family protein
MRPKIVIAYDATPAAADGLVLGRVLGDLRDADLLLARVLPDTDSTEATERAMQHWFHATLHETREAAEELLGDRPFELWPVFRMPVAEGINALAADQGAELIVFGSPERGPLGHVLLGNAAAAACEGAPCAVAIAPRGFRDHPAALLPPTIGVAFDGSAEAAAALDAGLTLARAGGTALRMVGVEPGGWSRPLRHHEPVAPALAALAAELEDGIDVETRVLEGDSAHALARETERLGLLVCGSRARGPLRRVMLGSVSSVVIRSAACPVVVVPRRVLRPIEAAPLAALTSG